MRVRTRGVTFRGMAVPVSRRRYPGLEAMGAALLLGACNPGGMCVVEPTVEPPSYIRDGVLRLVPTLEARPYLEAWLPDAALRLREASGLDVVLVPEDGASAVIEAPKAEEDGWYGSFRNGVLSLAIDTIEALAVKPSGIVLHEAMHGHGADHVGLGEGIMSPELAGDEPITAADLESLCRFGQCTVFNPERP